MGGRLGGRPISIVGPERYAHLVRVLHRDRRAIVEDPTLKKEVRQRVLKALDALLDVIVPFQPERIH